MSEQEWVTRGHYDGECYTCGMRFTAANAVGLAAQHARKRGHRVSVIVERTICYDYTGQSA